MIFEWIVLSGLKFVLENVIRKCNLTFFFFHLGGLLFYKITLIFLFSQFSTLYF